MPEKGANLTNRVLGYTTGLVIFALAMLIAWGFEGFIVQSVAYGDGAFGRIVQDYGTLPQGVLIVLAVVALSVPGLRLGYPLLARSSSALIAQAILHPLLFSTTLKFLWRRTRPVNVLAGKGDYTPFFVPNFDGNDVSFPSGHVAAALVLLPVIYLLIGQRRFAAAAIAIAVTVGWAGAVSVGRIVYGAHYLTDVVFSIGTALFFVPLSVRVGDWYLTKYDKKKSN